MEDSEDEDDAGSLMEEEQQQQARGSEQDPNLAGSQRQRFLELPPALGGSDADGGAGGYASKPRSPPAPVEALTGDAGATGLPLPQGDGKVSATQDARRTRWGHEASCKCPTCHLELRHGS